MVDYEGGDGTAPDPLVSSAGAPPTKRRRLVHGVRDHAMLPGPIAILGAIWASGWFNIPASALDAEDIASWPYLVKWVTFLGSLQWPHGSADLGVGGVSFVEMLIPM